MACIGYARVSSSGQSLDVQLERLAHCERIFQEKRSGTHAKRPALLECLAWLRDGDVLCVTKLDRLARSTLHLCQLDVELKAKGVTLHVLDQQIDTSTAVGRMLFQMLGVIAEFETALRHERQMDGIAHAQKLGKRFGPKPRLSKAAQALLYARYTAGDSAQTLMQDYGLSKSSLYRYLAQAQPEPQADAPTVQELPAPYVHRNGVAADL